MLEDKPIVVAKETTLFFPMLKDEPTTAAALSEPSLAATPKNTPNVHVSSPIKLLIRATILESEPEIATERGSFSNPSKETYISGEKILQPALMPTKKDKQIEIDGKKQAKIMTNNVYSRKF